MLLEEVEPGSRFAGLLVGRRNAILGVDGLGRRGARLTEEEVFVSCASVSQSEGPRKSGRVIVVSGM